MKSKFSLGLVLGLSMVGCGGGGSGSLYDTQMEAQASAIAVICECYTAVGAPDEAACLAEFADENTPAQEACVKDIVDANAAELEAALDCMTDIFADVETCVANVAACDPVAIEACMSAVEAGGDTCPQPPLAIETLIEACFAP